MDFWWDWLDNCCGGERRGGGVAIYGGDGEEWWRRFENMVDWEWHGLFLFKFIKCLFQTSIMLQDKNVYFALFINNIIYQKIYITCCFFYYKKTQLKTPMQPFQVRSLL